MKARDCLTRQRPEYLAGALLVLIYAVGLVSHLIPETRSLMVALTPYVLLLCGLGVLALSLPSHGEGAPIARFLSWVLAVTALTFGVEVAGVATGEIFGDYRYGEVLGVRLAGVPLVIGFNWTLVVLGSVLLSDRIIEKVGASIRARRGLSGAPHGLARLVLTSVSTGALSALFDLAMEPTAVRLGYWSWAGGIIPFRNYLAWFVLAATAGLFYRILCPRRAPILPVVYLFAQLCFFIALDFGISA
ncbi:MAG TPA: carotenoid biosynthesis protein [Spirochaetia bacterium]|nr:carotenoid biosynthesis protein [Spirochaetia bacterium]